MAQPSFWAKFNVWEPSDTMTHTSTNAALRQFISKYFSVPELDAFCYDYFPEAEGEFAPEMPKNTRVLKLVRYCERRGLAQNLLVNLQKERPEPYKQTFAAKPAAPPAPQPIKRNPRQIFISHAHQDAKLAQRLAADLEAEGYPVWIAPDSILPGEKWATAISRGLDESGIFVLLLTPEAVNSRWVQIETDVAVELEREGEMRLVPLQVKPCKLPALWRAYQRIAWRRGYDTGFAALTRAILGSRQEKTGLVMEKVTRIEVVEERVQKPNVLMPPRQTEINSFVHEKTGLEFVRIPAADFLYGDEKKETLNLPDYWMSKTPVTQKVYKRFIDANPDQDVPSGSSSYNWDKKKRTFPDGKADHPVVLVTWHDAVAFAEWADLRLPTEQEWENAARGTDGREYPWGNEWRDNHCNTSETGLKKTCPVGSYSPQGDSPYGCVDMSGNVWEWTNSWYDETEAGRVLRGGSWYYNHEFARVAAGLNSHPDFSLFYIGFRVVSPVSGS